MQNSFLFDETVDSISDSELGQRWNAPHFSTQEYQAIFHKAEIVIGLLEPGLRTVFLQGLATAKLVHDDMMGRRVFSEDQKYALWRTDIKPASSALDQFIQVSSMALANKQAGIEVKKRNTRRMLCFGVYIPDAGSVVVRIWPNAGCGIDYHVYRDPFFNISYLDEMREIEAPYSMWGHAYCADKIAYSDESVPSVPTFILNGREYIHTGGMSSGSYQECKALTFRPLEGWNSETYTYRNQCRAWDEGLKERGDQRGLVVSVRGRKCVVDGAVLVFDNNVVRSYAYEADSDCEEEIELDEVEA